MKHSMISAIATAGFLFTATAAFSEDLNFQMVSARSTGNGLSCDLNSVQMISAGNNMSLIFDHMNVNLPAGGMNKKLASSGVCTVAIDLTIPEDTYLMQASSQIFGGVEKSAGGSGSIMAAMYMVKKSSGTAPLFASLGAHGLMLYTQAIFPTAGSISEPLIQLNDAKSFTLAQQKAMCRRTKKGSEKVGMLVQLSVDGARKNTNQTTIINIDGADTNLEVGIPTGKCAKI